MATTSKPRVYLDSCCFIDVVKHGVGIALPSDREKDVWFLKKLLEAHRDGSIIVHTSILSVAECLAVEKGQDQIPLNVQERFRSLLTSGQFVYLLSPTPKTATLAQKFRWEHGLVLRGADALHYAASLEVGCQEFITTDERLKSEKMQKAAPALTALGIKLINAHKTSHVAMKERQMELTQRNGIH